MNNIVIFENEFVEVEAAFSAVNLFYFNEKLNFKVYATTQAAGDLTSVARPVPWTQD